MAVGAEEDLVVLHWQKTMLIRGKLVRRKGYCLLGDKVIPRGSNCFYWTMAHGFGIKVYHGLDRNATCSRAVVSRVAKKMRAMYNIGICVKPEFFARVVLDIEYNGRRIKKHAYGIVTRTLDMQRSDGKKEEFKENLPQLCAKHGIKCLPDYAKDCNIGYDNSRKQYRLVDVV